MAHEYMYPLILTAIVTISTVIYTICSIQWWRITRAAAEISRPAAFGTLWAELNLYLEILWQKDVPETAFLQKVSDLMLEFKIANLVNANFMLDAAHIDIRRLRPGRYAPFVSLTMRRFGHGQTLGPKRSGCRRRSRRRMTFCFLDENRRSGLTLWCR